MLNLFMQQAIVCAELALSTVDIPVGAIIVQNGLVIGVGFNQREAEQQVTRHAEIVALEAACKTLGRWNLADCDLYVTLEPCAMCAGAIIQARIRRLYFGAFDPKAGAAGSCIDLFSEKWLNHRVEVYGGIEEEQCTKLLQDFFVELRSKKED